MSRVLVKDKEVVRVDKVDDTTIYVGAARAGTAASAALWQIRRLTVAGTASVAIEWADGNTDYDNVWDNRASLSYS